MMNTMTAAVIHAVCPPVIHMTVPRAAVRGRAVHAVFKVRPGQQDLLEIRGRQEIQVPQFTVNQTGTYFISYVIKMTSGLPMSSRITRNDTPILNSISTSSTSSNEYSVSFMQSLTAGDVLSLQIYGVNGTVTLQSGTGASLNIVRIA